MEEGVNELSNDARASESLVWLLGWALVLPFAHPLRLAAYGLIPALLLVGLTVLFPDASVFSSILLSSDFNPRPLPQLVADGSIASWIVSLVTFVVTAFLLCTWQRDIIHRFSDPLPQLLAESFARVTEYVILTALWALLLVGVHSRNESMATVTVAAIMIGCFGRVAFLAPLIASRGWKAGIQGVAQIGMGRIIGSVLVFALLLLSWTGLVFLGNHVAISEAAAGDLRGFLIVDVKNIVVSLISLLWLSAVSALTVRISLKSKSNEADVFD